MQFYFFISFARCFERFADNFELNLDKITNKNPYLIVIFGDFNAKLSNWYKHDATTYEGSKIDAIASQFGLQQLIQEPTHILTDSSPCIDLIFTQGSIHLFIKIVIIN